MRTTKNSALIASFGVLAILAIFVGHILLATQIKFAWSLMISCVTAAVIAVVCANEVLQKRFLSPTNLFFIACFIHFVFAQWIISFGYVQFNSSSNYRFLLSANIFLLLCLLAFLGGVQAAYKIRFKERTIPFSQPRPATWTCAVLLGAGIFGRLEIIHLGSYTQVQRHLYDLSGQSFPLFYTLEMFPNLAMVGLFSLSEIDYKRKKWIVFSIALWLFNIIYWLPTGRKYETILSIITPLLVRLFIRGKVGHPVRIAIIALGIGALFPLTHAYRVAQVHYGLATKDDTSISDIVRIIRLSVTMTSEDLGPLDTEYPLSRLNLMESVAGAIGQIERGATLHFGTDYLNFILNQVPRSLWASKPDVNYGNDFGVEIGMIPATDFLTAISETLIAESYLNFSWFGFIFFALYGYFSALLYRWARVSGWLGSTVYIIFVFIFIYIGGTFALYYTSLIRNILFVSALYGAFYVFWSAYGNRLYVAPFYRTKRMESLIQTNHSVASELRSSGRFGGVSLRR